MVDIVIIVPFSLFSVFLILLKQGRNISIYASSSCRIIRCNKYYKKHVNLKAALYMILFTLFASISSNYATNFDEKNKNIFGVFTILSGFYILTSNNLHK